MSFSTTSFHAAIPQKTPDRDEQIRALAGSNPESGSQGPDEKLKLAPAFYTLILLSTGVGIELDPRRHQPCEGALLDSCHQRIVGPLISGRNPNRCFGLETEAGQPSSRMGWTVVATNNGNVRRGGRHVCCVELPTSLPSSRTLAGTGV